MIYLKEYNNYDNEVNEICKKYGIDNWSIRDGLVDVDGDVDLIGRGLNKSPLKFGRVSGNFYFSDNKLTTLEGSPKEVGEGFSCVYNKLTTLEYMPNIRGYININYNPLPEEILNLNLEKLKKVIYEQDFYEIWRDGKLFEPRWKELKIDLGIN